VVCGKALIAKEGTLVGFKQGPEHPLTRTDKIAFGSIPRNTVEHMTPSERRAQAFSSMIVKARDQCECEGLCDLCGTKDSGSYIEENHSTRICHECWGSLVAQVATGKDDKHYKASKCNTCQMLKFGMADADGHKCGKCWLNVAELERDTRFKSVLGETKEQAAFNEIAPVLWDNALRTLCKKMGAREICTVENGHEILCSACSGACPPAYTKEKYCKRKDIGKCKSCLEETTSNASASSDGDKLWDSMSIVDEAGTDSDTAPLNGDAPWKGIPYDRPSAKAKASKSDRKRKTPSAGGKVSAAAALNKADAGDAAAATGHLGENDAEKSESTEMQVLENVCCDACKQVGPCSEAEGSGFYYCEKGCICYKCSAELTPEEGKYEALDSRIYCEHCWEDHVITCADGNCGAETYRDHGEVCEQGWFYCLDCWEDFRKHSSKGHH